jgi:nucleoside-diphosphate-sugar epimerase
MLQGIKPDVVISFDWDGVGREYRNDTNLQMSNVLPLLNLAEKASHVGVKRFIGVGSQAEYGLQNTLLTTETERKPVTAYGYAKVAASEAIRNVFSGSPVWTWVRVFSVYGEGDTSSWLIPTLMKSFFSGEDVYLTAGTQRWSLLHALDAAEFFAHLVEIDPISEPESTGDFNLGHPVAPVLKESIQLLATLTKTKSVIHWGSVQANEDSPHLLQPCTARNEALGWSPYVTLWEGFERTFQWFSSFNPSTNC